MLPDRTPALGQSLDSGFHRGLELGACSFDRLHKRRHAGVLRHGARRSIAALAGKGASPLPHAHQRHLATDAVDAGDWIGPRFLDRSGPGILLFGRRDYIGARRGIWAEQLRRVSVLSWRKKERVPHISAFCVPAGFNACSHLGWRAISGSASPGATALRADAGDRLDGGRVTVALVDEAARTRILVAARGTGRARNSNCYHGGY